MRRAATTRVGSSASTATSVNAPSSWTQTRCIASVRSTSEASWSSSSWAATSVSVSETRPSSLGVGLDPGPQLGEVLDDPVVHQRHPPPEPEVRVRVDVVGRPVGRPAGVADAGRRGRQRVVGDRLLEVRELAGAFFATAIESSTTSAIPAES